MAEAAKAEQTAVAARVAAGEVQAGAAGWAVLAVMAAAVRAEGGEVAVARAAG